MKATEAVSDRLESGRDVPPEHLQKIVEFLQVFADKCHHGKEEDQLFHFLILPAV